MIVLIGPGGDECLRLVSSRLAKLKAPTLFIDQRQHEDLGLELSVSGETLEGTLRYKDDSVDLRSVTAIYSRLANYQDLPEFATSGGSEELQRCADLHGRIIDWFALGNHLLINPDFAQATNASKPRQLMLISQAGFLIPRSLITNDPDCVRAFLADCPAGIV